MAKRYYDLYPAGIIVLRNDNTLWFLTEPFGVLTELYSVEHEDRVFPDVPNGKWYTNSIRFSKNYNLITGYESGFFGLNDSITRGQIVTILHRLAGSPDASVLENPFEDVPEGKYYTDAVKWAADRGITTGKTPTSFDPNGFVTRQELAVFFARFAEKLGINTENDYDITNIADYNDLSGWAIAPMKFIMQRGVITGDMALGYPRILPKNNATRAEAATMFSRFYNSVMYP